jgi:molecular chaperone DnaJ
MAHVVVETPINLTDRQKELLREFDNCCSDHEGKHNPRAKGFMDKVKAFFAQ